MEKVKLYQIRTTKGGKKRKVKMYQVGIKEYDESTNSYGETSYPFETDQVFDWFDPNKPDISEVEAFLTHLGYDTEGIKFSPSGIEGVSVTGDDLDLVIIFPED